MTVELNMNPDFTLSASEFVLRVPADEGLDFLRQKFQKWGSVQAVPSVPGHFVLCLSESDKNPRATWLELRNELSQTQQNWKVLPVMIDREGNKRYPLGTIAVRFNEPQSKAQLESFSRDRAIHVINQNKYVPTQFSFEPSNVEAFFTDVLQQMPADDSTIVWPETISAFRRE
jgi:hypothetical protein